MSDEAHLSAEQSRAQTASRFPRPHGNGSRPQDYSRPSCPRPQVAERLSQLQAPAPQEKDRAIVTISKRADFLAANKGRRMAMAGFVLLVHDRRDGEPIKRLGIPVTQTIGDAVVRHRMKRRFIDHCRYLMTENEGEAGITH